MKKKPPIHQWDYKCKTHYMSFTQFAKPKNIKKIKTCTIYEDDELELWLDVEGKRPLGLQIFYRPSKEG